MTPDDSSQLSSLVEQISKAIATHPEDQDDESARWETKHSYFEYGMEEVLKKTKFSGEVLSDGEASGYGVQEWIYVDGELKETIDI